MGISFRKNGHWLYEQPDYFSRRVLSVPGYIHLPVFKFCLFYATCILSFTHLWNIYEVPTTARLCSRCWLYVTMTGEDWRLPDRVCFPVGRAGELGGQHFPLSKLFTSFLCATAILGGFKIGFRQFSCLFSGLCYLFLSKGFHHLPF